MVRKHGLDMEKVMEKIHNEVAPMTYNIFVGAGWTWIFTKKGEHVQRPPTVVEIVNQYKDNLRDALKWWEKSDEVTETLSCGRLRVAVHGKTNVTYIDFLVEADTYWAGEAFKQ